MPSLDDARICAEERVTDVVNFLGQRNYGSLLRQAATYFADQDPQKAERFLKQTILAYVCAFSDEEFQAHFRCGAGPETMESGDITLAVALALETAGQKLRRGGGHSL